MDDYLNEFSLFPMTLFKIQPQFMFQRWDFKPFLKTLQNKLKLNPLCSTHCNKSLSYKINAKKINKKLISTLCVKMYSKIPKMLENAKIKCNIGLTLFWPLKLGSIQLIFIDQFFVEVNQVRMFILKAKISSYPSKIALFLAKLPHFTGLQNRDHV